jgi:phosphoserine phosphatase RsbU/P
MEKIAKKLILTIDDDFDTRTYFKVILEENNYAVIDAENGLKGLELFKVKNPDLVLLDLRMPGMSGLEVLKELTQMAPQTPVIVVSATDSIDDVVESLHLGAWDFILKPMSAYTILLHRVDQMLERALLKRQNIEYQNLLEQALDKLQTDLKSGQSIQKKLLPQNELTFNQFRFNSLVLPSQYLSGDFVDYFAVNENYTAFYVADVSGHGVSSALVTVFLKSFMTKCVDDCLQNHNTNILDPVRLLEQLNTSFIKENLGKFCTMFYGVINHKKEQLVFCNSGHYPPPILRQNGELQFLDSKNTPIGILPEVSYENTALQLEAGFNLIFFSDGILDILPHKTLDEKIGFLEDVSALDKKAFQDFITGLKENATGLPDDITVLTIEKDS